MPKVLKAGERRSRNEENFEAELNKRGIKYEYEPESFVLVPAFEGSLRKRLAITYTPDYKLYINGQVLWVEVKGFARAEDKLKMKIADWFFTKKRNEKFIMVGNFGTLGTGLKDFYWYHHRKTLHQLENGVKKYGTIKKVGGKLMNYRLGKGITTEAKVPENVWATIEKLVGPALAK